MKTRLLKPLVILLPFIATAKTTSVQNMQQNDWKSFDGNSESARLRRRGKPQQQRRKLNQQKPCKFLIQDILYDETDDVHTQNDDENLSCELQEPGLEGTIVVIKGYSNEWEERNKYKAGKGSKLLPSDYSFVDLYNNELQLFHDPEDVIYAPEITYEVRSSSYGTSLETATSTHDDYYYHNNDRRLRRQQRQQKQRKQQEKYSPEYVFGTKHTLVVRVIAPDVQTTASAAQLSDDVFGTNGDSVNLKSQYEKCSYGKMKIMPAVHENVTNGVYEVYIDKNVTGTNEYHIRNAVTKQLQEDFSVTDLSLLFDHYLYCIPPGTDRSWSAYAFGYHWMSVYNDNYCSSVTTQMHEIGHNLGMGHSGEYPDKYGDYSGTMGHTSDADDTPSSCFNAAKSWQFGWYRQKSLTIDNAVELTGGWSGLLSGVTKYDTTSNKVLLKIPGDLHSVNDYYVNFNHADSFNNETRLGINQVLIVTKQKNVEGFFQSWLVGKLYAGESYIIDEMGIEIIVHTIDTELGEADITISTAAPTFSPLTMPSDMPSATPTTAPTLSPLATPTDMPSATPSTAPTPATPLPTITTAPTSSRALSYAPSVSVDPTLTPTLSPTGAPMVSVTPSVSVEPTLTAAAPTVSFAPSFSVEPTLPSAPTASPTEVPMASVAPTSTPTRSTPPFTAPSTMPSVAGNGEGYIISNNKEYKPFINITTFSALATRNETTIHMMVWSQHIDYNRMKRMEYEIKLKIDSYKGNLSNLYNGNFSGYFTLPVKQEPGVIVEEQGTIKLKIQDVNENAYERNDIPFTYIY